MAKKTAKKQSWNDIQGLMKIYGQTVGSGKKEFLKFSTSVSTKDEDGEYLNAYLSVIFAKKCKDVMEELSDGENWINIDSAFLTAEYYTDKNNKLIVKPAIMVMECSAAE